MAKYRCPSCGASHKDAPSSCRLCGYIMDGSVEIPSGGAQARAPIEKKGGLGGFALIGLLVVVLLGAGAVIFHLTSGNATVAKVIDKLPGQSAPPDGWKTVTDAEGGFTVSLPPEPHTDLGQVPRRRQRPADRLGGHHRRSAPGRHAALRRLRQDPSQAG